MNKYTELSDFEINRRIAEMDTKNRYVYFEKEQTIFRKFNNGQTQKFNPCNYPTDAMPIIIGNLISLMADMSEDRGSAWWCASDISNSLTSNYKSNPLRATMEVFLMIKDAENES
ncbi:DUF2591 domain-containing protein [Proteus vulgaris]|uniref:DUF2591 domain-containing protein n=1 Tax=Proteus vulgaris TaxID=585 RepID=UPI0021A58AA4|nr:DUF2591 domain-containing protein [Proteus vulgaris]